MHLSADAATKGEAMRRGVAVAIVIALNLLVLTPSGEAHSTQRRFRGVRVMPGGVVVGDRIVYEGGAVAVVPDTGTLSFDSCPSGNLCLFDFVNWSGDLFILSSCCAWNNLSNYGFNNRVSSWRNRLSDDGQLAKDAGGGGTKLCLDNNSYSSSMPSGWDNAASSARVRDASTYC